MNFDAVIEIGGVQEITHPIIKNYKLKEEGIYPRRYSDTIAYMRIFLCIEKVTLTLKNNLFTCLRGLFSVHYQVLYGHNI